MRPALTILGINLGDGRCAARFEDIVDAAGNEEADEPCVRVERFEEGYNQAAPGEGAPRNRGGHRVPVPSFVVLVRAVRQIEVLEVETRVAHQPVVGDEDTGDRAQTARVTEEPAED